MAQRKAAAANAAKRRSTAQFATRTGAHANAVAGVPGHAGVALTRDQLYFSSVYPNYANSPLPNVADAANCSSPNYCGIRKFIAPLPGLPQAVPDTTTFPGADYYEISLVQYSQKLHPDLPATTLRGYVQTNVATPLTPQYLGPLIIATSNRPVRLKFTNNLPTGTTPGPISSTNGNLFIPEDKTVMGSGLGFAKSPTGSPYLDSRATIHMHGGNTPWISDGTPHQWTVPAGNFTDGSTVYTRGDSVQFVPDMFFVNGKVVPQCGGAVTTNCSGGTAAQLPAGATNDPGNGSLTFYYTNQQSGRLLFYHDHSYGTTRLNVYVGEAGGYLITDQIEQDLINGTNLSGVFTTAGVPVQKVLPGYGTPLIIQDKTFVPPNPASTNVYSVPILENGSGYSTATVSFGAGCTVPPVATATVGLMPNFIGQLISGAVTGITMSSQGSGCTSAPSVTITGDGTGAAAYASLATLSQQDPTWDTTLWGGTGNLWYPHVYMTNQWPDNPDGSAVNPMGRWDYASWFWPVFTSQYQVRGELPCPTSYNTAMLCPGTPTPMDPAPTNYLAGTPGGAQLHQGAGSIASLTPEAFMDTPLVNGEAYPTYNVDPKPYRFRILSVGNDRTLNLSWFLACDQTNTNYVKTASAVCPAPTVAGILGLTEVAMVPSAPTAGFPVYWPTDGRDGGVPDPLASGPSWVQIANEGGVLPAPAVIPPAPINYEYNRRSVTVTNTSSHSLNLMPAERADVLVDFTPYAGKTLILYNDAPAPYPAFDSRYDYYTGDPDQTGMGGAPTTLVGFGPNTRTIMQVKVNSTASGAVVPVSIANLNALLPAAFKISQPVPVAPASVYNKVYGGNYINLLPKLADTQETFIPIGGTTPVTLPNRNKTIQELFELDYGRMNATLGTELQLTNFNTQTTIPLNYVDPFTEDLYDSAPVASQLVGSTGDGSQIWEVIHNGVDTHAIHFHLYNVQILDRVGWDGTVRYPDANEYGWKDTVRMNPLEIDFVAMRPMSQKLPFPVPDSTRLLDVTMAAGATDPNLSAFGPLNTAVPQTNVVHSLGWEYVWHCHILGHEENDMMRDQTFQVVPQTPTNLTISGTPTGNYASFLDQSLSETGFTLERADDALFTVNVHDFTLPAQPGYNLPVSYLDSTAVLGTTYQWRVQSFKPDADFYAPGANLVSPWSTVVPTTLAPSASINKTSLAFGNQLINTSSAPQTVILTNAGSAPLTIFGISVTAGTNSGYFALTNPCTSPLAVGASCTLSVRFNPLTVGAASAQIAITTNDPINPAQNVALTGHGQAAVTVTASSASISYRAPVPTITGNAVGLQAPDTITALTGMTCSTTYTVGSAVGSYTTTCSGSTNTNYVVTYVAGSVTVNKIVASVTPNAASKTYGAADPTLTGTLTGFLPVDGVTATYSRTAGTTPGTYTISATLAPTARLTNYTITYNTAVFTINPVAPVLTAVGAVGGVLPGSTVTFTWTASNPAPSSYNLWIGTQGVGSNNLKIVTGATSGSAVTSLPTAGGTVYVRLLYYETSNKTWYSVDYTFTAFGAATAPVLTSPGATMTGGTATFTWNPSNPVASTYVLWVGSTGVGSANLKIVNPATSGVVVTGLPTGGRTLYIRIWYTVGGVQKSVDFTTISN
jgi:FtsP/CotA-like multicopper oxidase with cupredoxin domain